MRLYDGHEVFDPDDVLVFDPFRIVRIFHSIYHKQSDKHLAIPSWHETPVDRPLSRLSKTARQRRSVVYVP
jgi:hypothetical protein